MLVLCPGRPDTKILGPQVSGWGASVLPKPCYNDDKCNLVL